MKLIIMLSKENLNLSKDEALSLTKKDFGLYDNLLITDSFYGLEKRLGFSHSIYEFLFLCKANDLEKKILGFNWENHYKKNFCVRAHGLDEKILAKMIFRKLLNPKVKLKKSNSQFEFFLFEDKVICGKFLYEVDKSHFKRKAHLRPSLHPTSMNPALAKACINLTGLKRGTILDPFCGSGGILIEAGLIGFNTIGYDIDKDQIDRAKANLEHYGVKSKLYVSDALKSKIKANAIVTDIPYGKSSKSENVRVLVKKFLHHAKKLTNNMVLIYPDFIKPDFKEWTMEKEYSIYIHKSLTRKIAKLRFAH